jgi:hypothetical protein
MSLSLLFDGTGSPSHTAYNSTEGSLICIYYVYNSEKVDEMPRNLTLSVTVLAQHKRILNEPSWKAFSFMLLYGIIRSFIDSLLR